MVCTGWWTELHVVEIPDCLLLQCNMAAQLQLVLFSDNKLDVLGLAIDFIPQYHLVIGIANFSA